MLHLAVIGIVCAVSALSEGTAFIEQKNDSIVFCNLSRVEKENFSSLPNYSYDVAVGGNLSGSVQKNFTNEPFFNEFNIKQYPSYKNSSSNNIESDSAEETKKYLDRDFFRRKKRNFQSIRKKFEITPKTLRPPVDDRTVLCDAQKQICSKKMHFKKIKKPKKKKKCKQRTQKFDLNCYEKKLFFRLKSKSCRNKLKCKKCKGCKRYLDRREVDDELDLNKRIEKLVQEVALENKRNGKYKKTAEPDQNGDPLKKKPSNQMGFFSFFEHIKKAFCDSKNYFRGKIKLAPFEHVNGMEGGSHKATRSYDILKTMRKVSRVRRSFISNVYNFPVPKDNGKRQFLFCKKRRFRNFRTEKIRKKRNITYRPGPIFGFHRRHEKLQKEEPTKNPDVISRTTQEVNFKETNSEPSELFPTSEEAFTTATTVTTERVVVEEILPQHTLERPILKENSETYENGPTTPSALPDLVVDLYLKIRHALRTFRNSNNNPQSLHLCKRKKRGCEKSSKPHRCWRTAPLLCLPYIKKGQEDQLKFLIKLLESMVGKPFPPEIDIFGKTKHRPANMKGQCSDYYESSETTACAPLPTECTTCAPVPTECTTCAPKPSECTTCAPPPTEIFTPTCPSTCPPPYPLTHLPTCTPSCPPCPTTSTPDPHSLCCPSTPRPQSIGITSVTFPKQTNSLIPPFTFPVMENQEPSFGARKFSQYFSTSEQLTSFPLGATPNSPSSTYTASGGTPSAYQPGNVFFHRPRFFQGMRLISLPDSVDSITEPLKDVKKSVVCDFPNPKEKLFFRRGRCKGRFVRLPDDELMEFQSLMSPTDFRKPYRRGSFLKSRRNPPDVVDRYYKLQRKGVRSKNLINIPMEDTIQRENLFSSLTEPKAGKQNFEIPQKRFFQMRHKQFSNPEFGYDYDFNEPYFHVLEDVNNVLFGMASNPDTWKYGRRKLNGIKKRELPRRQKRGYNYYSLPEKFESYNDYEDSPDYSNERLGGHSAENSDNQTFDLFFNELAKAISESDLINSTSPLTTAKTGKDLAARGTTEPSETKKEIVQRNATKPSENLKITINDTSRATNFNSDSNFESDPDKAKSTEQLSRHLKTTLKPLNESDSSTNSSTEADSFSDSISSKTDSDSECGNEETDSVRNTTNKKFLKIEKKMSDPKTAKKISLESLTESSRLDIREDKGLESNQDLDSAEEGQVPTTLKTALIAKGARRTTSKPSPKVYTRVYPDSLAKESDISDTIFMVKSTVATTSEQTTQAVSSKSPVDLKLRILAVCEGYLEVIKMIRAQNQTAGNDIDLQLARYCENIISQNFNSQSEKPPKKQDGNDSQQLFNKNATGKTEDNMLDENHFYKRENINSDIEVNPEEVTEESKENLKNLKNSDTREVTAGENETEDRICFQSKKMRRRKKHRKQKRQRTVENCEDLSKRGVTEDQIKMIKLLRKRKKELLSWLLNKEGNIKLNGIQEDEYFGDQNEIDQFPDEYSGTIKPRQFEKSLEEMENKVFVNESVFPVYAKSYGYDKGGEVREVDVIWRKVNEKTHEKQIFKNMSVLALLLTSTNMPNLNQEDSNLVGSNGFENEEKPEIQLKYEDKMGAAYAPTPTPFKNFTINITTTTTARTFTAANTTTAATTTDSSVSTKKKEKPSATNVETIITKPDSKTFVGRPPTANNTHSNVTRKSHRFEAAKGIFQEYSIEFLDYAVYILPIMFTILFFFCSLCCAIHISTVWKKYKKKKKKKKKIPLSSDETTESSDNSESESEKPRSKKKGLKGYLGGKKDKKFWKVLKGTESKQNQEKNSPEKKKKFLRFLKGKKDGSENGEPSGSPAPSVKPSTSSGDEKQVNWSDEQQKGKSEPSEAAERRELISLLEELKKIETEHVGEKKDVKSVQVQYMTQENENPVFRHPDFGYPYEKNVFGLPKGYSFYNKEIPFGRTDTTNAIDDCELYEDVNELTEFLPCKCGYYSTDYDCDFRINKKGRCERFVKIFRDAGLSRTQPFIDKHCRKNENKKGRLFFNKYRSISTDESEDLMGVTHKNVGTEVRIKEYASPLPLRHKKNASLVEEMENLKRQLNKKKNVRLKDDGVLCRL